jgi:hypothetical protein
VLTAHNGIRKVRKQRKKKEKIKEGGNMEARQSKKGGRREKNI